MGCHATKTTKSTEFSDYKSRILSGDMASSILTEKKIVRLFISSTFKDSIEERNYLMKEIYPKLRAFCENHGLQFMPVDLRWGIEKKVLSDYKITDVCLTEVDRCFSDSLPGPCFVFLSFNRYGSCPLPYAVKDSEFEGILQRVQDEEHREMFKSCYQIDKNAIPNEYVLKPERKQFEQFPSATTYKEQKILWHKKQAVVKGAVTKAISDMPDLKEEEKLKWLVSVTEKEVRRALENREDLPGRCFAIKRDIEVDDKTSDVLLKTFVDDFKTNRKELRQLLTTYNIPTQDFKVDWTGEGVTHTRHTSYFEQFGETFKSSAEAMISKALEKLPKNLDLVTMEVASHLLFCKNRAKFFFGRGSLLSDARVYLKQYGGGKNLFVIYGISGSGKTSLLAKIAEEAYNHFIAISLKPVIVVRFCGTSPESSTAFLVMKSICQQIFHVFDKNSVIPDNYDDMINTFSNALKLATEKYPLVVVIDSLDQLSNNENGRSNLRWIPRDLPLNVYFIVSTVTNFGGSYESLCSKNLPTENYFQIKPLEDSDCDIILDSWLKNAGRTLTKDQREYILSIAKDTAEEKPSAIRLRLLYQISCECASYDKLENLPVKTVDLIALFLEEVERDFGSCFVSTLFGLLDTSKRGISENDLLDILSCDDSVLKEALNQMEAPIPRVPQIVLSRLRYRFGEYVIDRGAYGKRVLGWYHRQFWETAHKRYVNKNITDFAESLKQFFSGELSEKYKDRHISPQPLSWRPNDGEPEIFNEQKLQELPWAAMRGKEPRSVEEILCNFDFLKAKCRAGFSFDLKRDFDDAVDIVKSDRLKEYRNFVSNNLFSLNLSPEKIIEMALSENGCVKADCTMYIASKTSM